MTIYAQLTREFNRGRLRAILSGGQAVVLHRLAIMSKDGDWVLREDEEALRHVLRTLSGHGARYRYGAPLDLRWMTGGWSAHFEFSTGGLRVRTDFVTRPPRLDTDALRRLWAGQEQACADVPFLPMRDLLATKKTNREKDYAVIGELARRLTEPDAQLLESRSARDLMALAASHPAQVQALAGRRPVLAAIGQGVAALEAALDAERRALMHANEDRLRRYADAARQWAALWPAIDRETAGMSLERAHAAIVARAHGVLPTEVQGGWPC